MHSPDLNHVYVPIQRHDMVKFTRQVRLGGQEDQSSSGIVTLLGINQEKELKLGR